MKASVAANKIANLTVTGLALPAAGLTRDYANLRVSIDGKATACTSESVRSSPAVGALLKAYPEAAQQKDGNGRLPLHQALNSYNAAKAGLKHGMAVEYFSESAGTSWVQATIVGEAKPGSIGRNTLEPSG